MEEFLTLTFDFDYMLFNRISREFRTNLKSLEFEISLLMNDLVLFWPIAARISLGFNDLIKSPF